MKTKAYHKFEFLNYSRQSIKDLVSCLSRSVCIFQVKSSTHQNDTHNLNGKLRHDKAVSPLTN